jgi:hypothetical protein
MKRVRYTGKNRNQGSQCYLRTGFEALMNAEGLVQLDGKEDWRIRAEHKNLWCFGWHDLGPEWEEIL